MNNPHILTSTPDVFKIFNHTTSDFNVCLLNFSCKEIVDAVIKKAILNSYSDLI